MEHIPDNKTQILVVDDDIGLLTSIKNTLLSTGMPEPALLSDSRKVLDLVREYRFNLVLLDLMMPHINGITILQQLKREFPDTECLIVTAVDEISTAVQAMKFGAYDYLVKPLHGEKLIISINNALEKYNLKHGISLYENSPVFSDLKNHGAFEDMIAEDQAMARIFHQAEACASNDYNLIITGETGTGKEMITRIIHRMSHRSKGPFIAVNMGALSNTLFEDELFGHEEGAFTGAVKKRKGFFETAQGGTLFLDEIAGLDPALQGKLLRVVEEQELFRLGSAVSKPLDIRIISATNRDLRNETKAGRFREDLFYRLNMFQIAIPPLRERKKDILPLARHFLKVYAGINHKDIETLAPDFIDCLMDYSFPGNVRELEHVIAAAVVDEKKKVLSLSPFTAALLPMDDLSEHQADTLSSLADLEKRHIFKVLEASAGNRSRAAKILGINLRTLQRKLKAFSDPSAAAK